MADRKPGKGLGEQIAEDISGLGGFFEGLTKFGKKADKMLRDEQESEEDDDDENAEDDA